MEKLLVFITLIFCLSFVAAQEIPQYRDLYVNDFAGIFSPEDADFLREIFMIVEENTTAEVVFVSFDTIGGNAIDQYAFEIGNAWGVGKEDKDNGVVILYVADVNRIFVATGYGVEGILPDSKIGRFLDEHYVPFRDAGNVSEGIIKFSLVLADEMIANGEEIRSGKGAPDNSWVLVIFVLFIALMVFLIVISLRARNYRGRKSGWFPVFVPTGFGGRSSGGGFSSGGGSFGGGSFGGGGAGR